jgi:hypothetical protein
MFPHSLWLHVGSLWSARAIFDAEGHGLSRAEIAITFARDRAVMDENIWAIGLANEAEAFRAVEPFDGA